MSVLFRKHVQWLPVLSEYTPDPLLSIHGQPYCRIVLSFKVPATIPAADALWPNSLGLYHLLPVGPSENCFTFLCLSSLICKMVTILAPISLDCYEDQFIQYMWRTQNSSWQSKGSLSVSCYSNVGFFCFSSGISFLLSLLIKIQFFNN